MQLFSNEFCKTCNNIFFRTTMVTASVFWKVILLNINVAHLFQKTNARMYNLSNHDCQNVLHLFLFQPRNFIFCSATVSALSPFQLHPALFPLLFIKRFTKKKEYIKDLIKFYKIYLVRICEIRGSICAIPFTNMLFTLQHLILSQGNSLS